MNNTNNNDRLLFRLWASALLLIIAVTFALTLDDMGMTDDDDFYVPAGIQYIKWVERAVRGVFTLDFSPFSQQVIERYWWINHEHPSVAKLFIGAGWLFFHKYTGLLGEIDAGRVGVMAMALILVFLVFHFTWENFGRRAAIFATIALFLLPRTFFHMHVPTLDLPVTAMYFLVVYAAWRAEKSWVWIILAGIFYGVAMCTKLNGPFAAFPLTLYWLYRWRQSVVLKAQATLKFKRMFITGLSMVFLSFPVFYALWPWIWHNTADKLVEFFNFHYHHYGIRLLYLGDIYIDPFAPWHAMFVYTAWVIPFVILALGLWSFAKAFGALGWRNLARFPEGASSERDYLFLVGVNAAFSIGIVAFSDVPKYGGVKLFQPFFPFFAILAGVGFKSLTDNLIQLGPLFQAKAKVLVPIVGLLCLLPGLIGMAKVYPYMLSYYNSLAGNLQGATEAGMERQYYDMCYETMIDYWNEFGTKSSRVMVSYEPNLTEYRRTYRWYKRDKKLRPQIFLSEPDMAKYVILTHERRWSHYQELLHQYRKKKALHTEYVWGVPLWTVYENEPKAPQRHRQ